MIFLLNYVITSLPFAQNRVIYVMQLLTAKEWFSEKPIIVLFDVSKKYIYFTDLKVILYTSRYRIYCLHLIVWKIFLKEHIKLLTTDDLQESLFQILQRLHKIVGFCI